MRDKNNYALGRCNCGAVRFEIRCPIADIYMCHCSICRAYSGSSNFAVVVIPKEEFTWTQGVDHVRSWKKPGHDWESHFCSTCGSSLPGDNDAKSFFIPAGLIFQGGENLRVTGHVCTDSKASWEVIPQTEQKDRENVLGENQNSV